MRIVAVGECTRDLHVDRGVSTVGGISLNFAVQARRSLGPADQVALVSAVGTDAAGEAVRALLARAGVDATHVQVRPGATASQRIHRRPGGERHFPPGGYDPGVLADVCLDAAARACIAAADVVAVPWFRQLAPLAEAALAAAPAGALRAADLLDGEDLGPDLARLPSVLASLDLAFISGDDRLATRLLPLAPRGGPVIVVTRGAAGSTALVGHRSMPVPAVFVPEDARVDTTGCGDAFQAAFTVAFRRGEGVEAALAAGGRAAAAVIRHVGAVAPERSA